MFETKNAIANGSSEIDMVINIGFLKDGRYEEVEEEIKAAGGISSFDDAEKFISLGASRLGRYQDYEKYRRWCRILISENEELKNEYSIND